MMFSALCRETDNQCLDREKKMKFWKEKGVGEGSYQGLKKKKFRGRHNSSLWQNGTSSAFGLEKGERKLI